MKAYISGKITGDSDHKKKFAHAKVCLETEGFVVLNPAELPEGMRPADYMRICMAMMDSADVVAFLPDYECKIGRRSGSCSYPEGNQAHTENPRRRSGVHFCEW